jgi:hypothetical protein
MWLLSYLLLSFTAHASVTLKTQVYDIDYGAQGEKDFLLLTSGHVAWMKTGHAKGLISKNIMVQVKISDHHELESLTVLEGPISEKKVFSAELWTEEEYTPTVLENLELAKTYFHESHYVNKESQCYNRAHIWSYEWFLKHHINSNKTWLFFTRRYIRKFKFNWWFHVSPSVAVQDGGVVREKIMDVKYARGPLSLKQWTDIFLQDDANCPVVKTYSEYANFPESGSCFTMRSSMFYYQPFDIESKETWGTQKSNWYDDEIKAAYLEAFDQEI